MTVGLTSIMFWLTFSMLSAKAMVDPFLKYPWTTVLSRMCERGRKEKQTSLSETSMISQRTKTLAKTLAWVRTTPLGIPVVPEV